MEIYKLNKEQQKAFNALKRAVNKCEKLNIGFINIYGDITAFDKSIIKDFGVDCNYEIACMKYGYPSNTINNLGGDSYADDQSIHSFELTDKGRLLFYSDDKNRI